MSAAVDSLRGKAARLLDQARDAETKAAEAAQGIEDRNAQRRKDFWADGVERTHTAQANSTAARDAFTAAVADGGDVLGAYLTYAKAHSEFVYLNNAAASALVVQVDHYGKPTPDGTGQSVYPGGLTPIYDKAPQSFVDLYAKAVAGAVETHRADFSRAYTAPLTDSLEPDPDNG